MQKKLIPIISLIFCLWVFAKPISALMHWVYGLSAGNVKLAYDGMQEAKDEAVDLLDAQQKLSAAQKTTEELQLENQILKSKTTELNELEEALKFKKSTRFKVLATKVIGRSPDSWHKQVIINKGHNDGVELGQGVITERGIVGQVTKTFATNSIVHLIYNQDFRMGAINTRSRVLGVLRGSNSYKYGNLELVRIDSDMQVGDGLLSSGVCLDAAQCPYPRGYPIGRVVDVHKDPEVIDLVIKVEFFEDLTQAKELFVIL